MADFDGSVFEEFMKEAYPFEFAAKLRITSLFGGIPGDPDVADGWLRKHAGETTEEQLQRQIAQTMVQRGVDVETATTMVKNKKVNGFKKDENGLYIEGRQVKAAIKEAVSVAVAGDKLESRGWGMTNKSLMMFVPEHIFVVERTIYLLDAEGKHITAPSGVNQSFISTHLGTGITNTEYVDLAHIEFTVRADWPLTDKQWAMVWLTGQHQGIGATRSQGYGVYEVIRWDKTVDTWDDYHAEAFKRKAAAMEAKAATAAKKRATAAAKKAPAEAAAE